MDRLDDLLAEALDLLGGLLERRALDHPEAHREVVDAELLVVALELAERIAENAPLAVRGAKRVVVESRDWPMEEAFERQLPIYEPIRSSEDAREGARAFTEKRPPEWRGR